MTTDEIRIGIIGAGANTRLRHIPKLQAIEGVRLVGVVNRSEESSRRVAEEFGIERIYGDWREAIADPRTNAIVIGTWPYLHCPATVAALEAGKHVLVEARMAMNADEARKMLAAAEAHPKLVAQVVPAPMTLEVDDFVVELVDSGRLGRLLAIEVRGGGAWLDAEAPMHWRQDVELSGVNILSLGIWYEIVMRWAGEAESVAAMASIFVPARPEPDGRLRQVKVPDHLDVVARMRGGAQLHVQLSAATGAAGASEVFLFGDRGTLRFSQGGLWFAGSGEKELRPIEVPAGKRGGWRVEEEFAGAIRGREPVRLTTFADGVRYMDFTEAVARAAGEGCTVTL